MDFPVRVHAPDLPRQHALLWHARLNSRDEHAVLVPLLDAVEGGPRTHVLVESQLIPTRAHVPSAFRDRVRYVVLDLSKLGRPLGGNANRYVRVALYAADVGDVCHDAVLNVQENCTDDQPRALNFEDSNQHRNKNGDVKRE